MTNTGQYCDNCLGDGESWIEGTTMSKTVRNIEQTERGWLCEVCRQYDPQPKKAHPIAKVLRQQKRAA